MLGKLFVIWLALIPLITFNNSYEGPKVLWFLIGSIPLFIFLIFKSGKRLEDLVTKSDLFFAAWLSILTLSSIFGVHPLQSFIGGSYRHQGIIFFLSIWVIGKTIRLLGNADQKFLYKLLLIAGLIEGLLLIFERIVSSNEPVGTFGEANAAAGFIALTLLLPHDYLNNIQKIIVYSVSSLGILLSHSATAILIFVYDRLKPKYFLIILTILIVGGAVIGGNHEFNNPHEGRGIIWKVSTATIFKRPILGYGAESGEVVLTEGFRENGTRLENFIVERSHNIVLDILMWSGVTGLIALSFYVYYKLMETSDKWRTRAFFGWLIFAFIQPLGVAHFIILVVILG